MLKLKITNHQVHVHIAPTPPPPPHNDELPLLHIHSCLHFPGCAHEHPQESTPDDVFGVICFIVL